MKNLPIEIQIFKEIILIGVEFFKADKNISKFEWKKVK